MITATGAPTAAVEDASLGALAYEIVDVKRQRRRSNLKGSEGLVFDGVSDASRESKRAANDPRGAICFRIFAQDCAVVQLNGDFKKFQIS